MSESEHPSATERTFPVGGCADLVLEGGGVKGIALAGAVLALAERGYSFPRVAGTSAGAIVASLVAACQARGKDLGRLKKTMDGLDYAKFRDGSWLTRVGWKVGEGLELLLHDGVHRGNYLREWLGNELADIGVQTFGDLRIDDDPETSLPPDKRYRLVVHASDLSRNALVRLPWDYDRYGLAADTQLIVDAVRASMSIPFFFRPVSLKCGDRSDSVTLVDGGLLSNFPITAFDRTDGRPPRWPTWGVKLSAQLGPIQLSHAVRGPFDIARGILSTLLSGWDRYHLDDEGVTGRTVFVDTGKLSSVDFGLDDATQQWLYTQGRLATMKFLDRQQPAAVVLPAEGPAPATAQPPGGAA
jgi:NTE family protein